MTSTTARPSTPAATADAAAAPAVANANPPPLDDRVPFEAADAVVQVVARLSRERLSVDDVWGLIYAGMGERERPYVEAIRRTRYSVFYYQMQQLYEFGLARLPGVSRAAFCDAVGREYTDRVLDELIPALIQVALARAAGFQAAWFEMIRLHLGRHAGNIYATTADFSPSRIDLSIAYARPEPTAAYLRQVELDPARCFANSFLFIAGAAERFAERTIDGYDPKQLRLELPDGAAAGRISFPVGERERFAFDSLIETLMRYVRELEAGRLTTTTRQAELESALASRSPAMQETWNRIRRASLSDEIVLLRGESGTGKSFVARRIHELSRRRDRPFIEVGLTSDLGSDNLVQSNLFGHERGAFTGASERKLGLFSLADGGTIFLDEVGDASPELQAKLLRVIDTRSFKRLGGTRDEHVDVRVIAATHQDLEQFVRQQRFREDLYYRLNVIPVVLPPLRHRAEDIPGLAQLLLERACAADATRPRRRLPAGLAERLKRHAWPGNIRELEHALRHALALGSGEEVAEQDFPPAVRAALGDAPAAGPGRADLAAEAGGGENADRGDGSPVVDEPALRRAIRAADAVAVASADRPEEHPAHVSHARRAYLAALIDELGGDLALVGLFWDHGSEKTLRKAVRDLGLEDRLAAARARRRHRRPG